AGFAASPRSRAAADAASACSSESSRTRTPVARRSTTISADSSTMRPASAAPSISDGASNHAVATPSTTRQSVPISVMPGTVQPVPDDLLPDSGDVADGLPSRLQETAYECEWRPLGSASARHSKRAQHHVGSAERHQGDPGDGALVGGEKPDAKPSRDHVLYQLE